MIKFISHETYPDDLYIKEACYLTVDDSQRFCYVRKARKDGAMYWTPISATVTKNGEKKFIQSFEWDSNFLQKDIIEFLNGRSWEKRAAPVDRVSFGNHAGPFTQAEKQAPQYQQQDLYDPGEPPF